MFKRIRAWFAAPAASEAPRPADESAAPSGSGGVLIDFGDNVFSGANISFGSITGGSLIQHSGPPPDLEHVGLSPYASEEHLRDLEAVYLKNRTLLRQQIESFGDHVPAHVVWQLNDTERYLSEIELRLAQLSRPTE